MPDLLGFLHPKPKPCSFSVYGQLMKSDTTVKPSSNTGPSHAMSPSAPMTYRAREAIHSAFQLALGFEMDEDSEGLSYALPDR